MYNISINPMKSPFCLVTSPFFLWFFYAFPSMKRSPWHRCQHRRVAQPVKDVLRRRPGAGFLQRRQRGVERHGAALQRDLGGLAKRQKR